MSKISTSAAIRDALHLEMEKDPTVYVLGEDVGFKGGDWGEDKGLFDKFGGKRACDTGISETAIVGHAVGSAAVGLRPIVELMHMDFQGVAMDEIMNQAAKMRYMFGGKATLPMVIKTSAGGGMSAAAQHSQMLEAMLAHIPGLKIVAPSTPADAKGLITAAIRDNNPVVYIQHKKLMAEKGEVPEGEYVLPIGKANTVREGKDVTIVSWSRMVHFSLEAATKLAAEGIDAEVIDLRTIIPLDTEAIINSVKKTGHLVIVHEAVKTCGFGAEIAARMSEEAFEYVKAPIARVTAPDCPSPFNPKLEQAYLPNADKIVAAVKKSLTYGK